MEAGGDPVGCGATARGRGRRPARRRAQVSRGAAGGGQRGSGHASRSTTFGTWAIARSGKNGLCDRGGGGGARRAALTLIAGPVALPTPDAVRRARRCRDRRGDEKPRLAGAATSVAVDNGKRRGRSWSWRPQSPTFARRRRSRGKLSRRAARRRASRCRCRWSPTRICSPSSDAIAAARARAGRLRRRGRGGRRPDSRARAKSWRRKRCDLFVANDISAAGIGFGPRRERSHAGVPRRAGGALAPRVEGWRSRTISGTIWSRRLAERRPAENRGRLPATLGGR